MKTADKIIKKIDEMRRTEKFLNPQRYLDVGVALASCLIDEHADLEKLRQEVSKRRRFYIEAQVEKGEKKNVSLANVYVEAEDLHRESEEQKHRCDRIEEFIRLCKLQGQTANTQY